MSNKMKLSDLKIGQKIKLFTRSSKKILDGTIVALEAYNDTLESGVITAIYKDTVSEKIHLYLYDYKAGGTPEWKSTFWCFPENTKFINHVKFLWGPKIHKPYNHKYDGFAHDNNAKQLEMRLAPQRTLVGKIMENGYIWYDVYGKPGWAKLVDPKIIFDKHKKRYYVETPQGFTRVTKIGTVIALENPEAKYE